MRRCCTWKRPLATQAQHRWWSAPALVGILVAGCGSPVKTLGVEVSSPVEVEAGKTAALDVRVTSQGVEGTVEVALDGSPKRMVTS